MDKKLQTAIRAAKAAGEVALKYFGTALSVEYKGDASPVTRADRECEKLIVEILRKAFPDYGVLGEEFGEQEGAGARWIIDPIDGTKNFIRGIPYFATLIALEEEGEVTTGVIYAPAMDDLLYAQRGGGAFDNRGRLQVSEIESLRQGTIVFGGLDAFQARHLWPGFEALVHGSDRQRGFGDYFGHTFIARGQAEAMVELDLKPYDVAPLKIIIEEAGGRFTDLKGVATIYGNEAVTSNGRVHDEVLDLMRC
jgi:histidinol phosphatase-like enzyme (inositol monophosphatase family)